MAQTQLQRQLGVFGATMMGLGSIIGTGVFVSIAIATDVTGASIVLAVGLAAFVAIFNGLNSAQLAANHPVSGGTYAYGYRYLNEWLGFTAGWMFLLAKSASAATAALGFAGYALHTLNIQDTALTVPIALGAVGLLTALTVGGIRRSNAVNIGIVALTLLSLGVFVLAGLPSVAINGLQNFTVMSFTGGVNGLLNATALMFVAYTGYGRIATMGEEVREPRRTIPRAIITTLIFTMFLYVGVAFVAIGSVGAPFFSSTIEGNAAPLEIVARTFVVPQVSIVLAIGAMTAMLGVLLNLILGLSRVLLAMGRQKDMPAFVGRLNAGGTTPYVAVIVMGVFIGALTLLGSVKTTWSFSAVTVLIYYALTNLSALMLKPEERLFPRWVAYAGLLACFSLTFFVDLQVYMWAGALIVIGLGWKWGFNRLQAGR